MKDLANKLIPKLAKNLGKIGKFVSYRVLLLYYAYRRKATPNWAKGVILGTLGYFISFIDFIPDIIPGLGYTDDIGMIMAALSIISFYVNADVKNKAQETLNRWFDGRPQNQDESSIRNELN